MDKFAVPKRNYIFIVAGLCVMLVGYLFLLGGGAESPEVFNYKLFSFTRMYVAPLLILAGFGIEVYAIMHITRKSGKGE